MFTSKDAYEYAQMLGFIEDRGVYNKEEDTYTIDDIEYQFRDYFNGEFQGILVRFPLAGSHSPYCEYRVGEYEKIEDVFIDAFSEETINRLEDRLNKMIIEGTLKF